ncbi:MAG TPA: prolyl oligopeptidase family serine peptidase [Candidatus Dormibacteraeota bacterium]|nr:prolyl oligopeptidase family serine peptidase [Candidatus Dormibacteraeota bacterium]
MPAPLRPEDIYRFRWLDHVRLSPSGEHVAYEVRWADAESRSNQSRVVVRRVLDPEPIEAGVGPRHDHAPEWSPDGRRLAFVSKHGAADQIFVMDLAGGESRQLSSVPEGASSPVWSPDGTHVAFVGTVASDPDDVVDDPRPPESSDQVRRTPVARVVRTLDYKFDGVGYRDGRHQHLFVVSADGGQATQLTNGAWDVGGVDWSPDGTRLVVVGNADEDRDLHRETHVYTVDFSGNLEKIATGYDVISPIWSPRGDVIAYSSLNGDEAGLLDRLWIVPATGGAARCLTANLDLAVGDGVITDMRAGHGVPMCWSRDGDRVYFPASGPGATGIYSVDLQGNVRAEVGGQRRIYDFDVSGGVIAFAASDTSDPGELHVVMQGAEARLTDLNPWLRERYIAQPEEHSFTAPDGWVMQGWLLKPPGFDPSRAYPLVMEVHGGPHAEYGWAFFHEFQVLAGMGFLVFYMNPRGSDGYGEVFRRAVVKDWGGKDYIDLMTALDQVIERTGAVDPERIGIGGGSYGGFMTNWAIGHTDRFAAAVSMRSISNLVSEYAQHDIVLWGELELGPPPWPDTESLWNNSPIKYVREMKTPLLLTCGEMDLRCAISQSEELFGAMRLLGKTVELVRFPDESHDISRNGRPDRRVERLRRIAGWFEKYLGTGTTERRTSVAATVPPAPAPVEEQPPAEPEPEPEPAPVATATAVATEPEATEEPLELPAPLPEEAAEAVPVVVAEPEPVMSEPAPVEPEPAPAEPALVEPEPEPVPAAAETVMLQTPAALAAEAAPPEPEPEPAVAETQAIGTLPAEPAPEVAATVPPAPAEPPPPEEETVHVAYPEVAAAVEPAPVPEPPAQPAEPTWGEAEAPAPAPSAPVWQEEPPAAAAPTWSEPAAAAPGSTWDQEPAAEASAPTWDAAPAPAPTAPPAPEPPPVAPAQPAPPQPNAGSTIVAWPGSAPPPEAPSGYDNGGASSEAATSIMPAWSPPQAAATKETLALHALEPEPSAQGEPPAKLTFETGPFARRVVGIPDSSATVGRAPDNDIIIGDPATSGHHCRIELRQGAYWISDLGSTNGTLVNGEPIIDKQLDHGDVISIGQNTIRFTLRS